MNPKPNSLQVMNTLPPDLVRQLAHAAQGLATSHVKGVRQWPWQTMGRGLVRCDQCERTWVKGTTPQHSLSCKVGRTEELGAKVIEFALPQRRRDDVTPASTAEALDGHTLRITEVPSSHERSDGRTEAGRPGGDLAAIPYAPTSSYREPLAWDPRHNAVVDDRGNVVADMVHTDLSILEQETFGLRIVACLNYFKGSPNEWIGDTRAALDAAKQAVSR